jgi:hypothetical protein
LPLKVDIVRGSINVRFGPFADMPAQDGMSASPLKADIRTSGQHVR